MTQAQRYLDEVAEQSASGDIARVYQEIRSTLGLPFVALVYRHLATEPRLLLRTWTHLEPLLRSDNVQSAAAVLANVEPIEVVPIPASALAAVGWQADELQLTDSTLRAYDRSNSVNLLALQILLNNGGSSGTEPLTQMRSAAPELRLLPMCDLKSLDARVLALLEELSVPFGGSRHPRLIPSLWRHFADPPALPALLWTSMRRSLLDGSLSHRADALRIAAGEVAKSFRVDDIELDSTVKDVLTRFVPAMARMVIGSASIRSALAEGDIIKTTSTHAAGRL